MAHVHVVIIGLTKRDAEPAEKRLFSYDDLKGDPVESRHIAMSPYLFDASGLSSAHLIINGRSEHFGGLSRLVNGNVAADGGNLVFDAERRALILKSEPNLADLIRPFVGGDDLLNNQFRYCFWLVDCPVQRIKSSVALKNTIRAVREVRLASTKAATRTRAETASLFTERRQPTKGRYLAVPRTSSERRDYIPLGYLDHTVIAANDLQIVPDATIYDFALIQSAMHNAWARVTSGRLESRIRYSAKFTYNTFPPPPATADQISRIGPIVQAVLDARNTHPDATLADLYDPDLMPPNLRKAHRGLDAAIDRLYRATPFGSDRERVEHLFGLYEKLVTPLTAAANPPKRSRQKRSAQLA